jgi:hypothetical protein
VSTTPPDDTLQPFIELAQALRNAAASRNHAELGLLISEHLDPELVDVMAYIRSPLGNLTLIGRFVDFWSPLVPDTVSREPTLDEMAVVLRLAARQ